jgi:hypothetical protein
LVAQKPGTDHHYHEMVVCPRFRVPKWWSVPVFVSRLFLLAACAHACSAPQLLELVLTRRFP